jgi:hypothetical protein
VEWSLFQRNAAGESFSFRGFAENDVGTFYDHSVAGGVWQSDCDIKEGIVSGSLLAGDRRPTTKGLMAVITAPSEPN